MSHIFLSEKCKLVLLYQFLLCEPRASRYTGNIIAMATAKIQQYLQAFSTFDVSLFVI